MKKSICWVLVAVLIVLSGCTAQKNQEQEVSKSETNSIEESTYVISDMAAREVKVPSDIDLVFSRCPIGTIIMYTLNPEKIAGLNWAPTESEKEFLSKEYLKLPMLSGWYAAGKEGNVEEIIKVAPDIILSSYSRKASQASIDQANDIQEKLHIPVVMIDSSLEGMEEMYTFVGKLIGEETRAQELKDYIAKLMEDVKNKQASIKESERVRVYYAEGNEGLLTDPKGSEHSEVIDLVGGINVAQVKIKSGMGRSQVSPEQLANWSPDVVITCHDQGFAGGASTYEAVLNDPRINTLEAVKNGKVYEIPYKPFNCFDRPPSVNRLIGIKWLGDLLYPQVYNYNIENEFKEFYKLFYNIDLTQEQIDDLLEKSK